MSTIHAELQLFRDEGSIVAIPGLGMRVAHRQLDRDQFIFVVPNPTRNVYRNTQCQLMRIAFEDRLTALGAISIPLAAKEWHQLDSQVLGFTLDLDEIPELAGKYVYLACEVMPSAPEVEMGLWTSQLGSQGVATNGTDGWQIISFVDKMPDSGTVSFGLQLHAATAGDTVAVAAPALAELGARYGSWGAVSLSDLTGLGRAGVLRELG